MFRHILTGVTGRRVRLVGRDRRAEAQAPTFDTACRRGPGRPRRWTLAGQRASLLGHDAGRRGGDLSDVPPRVPPISGRTGATGVTRPGIGLEPGLGAGPNDQPQGMAAPRSRPTRPRRTARTRSRPAADDDGPPDGLTLDQAIERMIRENLDLRGKFYEIPQAQADILTAGLRANPVFYADAQLVPYGRYTRDRPGGQTQYDVNISYPLDVSRSGRRGPSTRPGPSG